MKCRTCCNLSYRSQSEASYDRALRRARTVYQKTANLGWRMEHNLSEFPPKPKGMHWETYYRLWEKHAQGLGECLDHWKVGVARLIGRSDRLCALHAQEARKGAGCPSE
jgi:hypothetical protein